MYFHNIFRANLDKKIFLYLLALRNKVSLKLTIMFKGHPKGLYVAFFANMGERFGFYTMMACLVFFLQARYNLGADTAGSIYSWYYFFIYALALVGGFIADKTQNFKGTILTGIITMLAGYVLMTIPGLSLPVVITALFIIAFGNGLFKGNLQAIVGQLYDDPKYNKLRDTAFNIFYMGINIGAFFAPSAANGIRNWYLKTQGFTYNSDLAMLSNQYLDGSLSDPSLLSSMGAEMIGRPITDLAIFSLLLKFFNSSNHSSNHSSGLPSLSFCTRFSCRVSIQASTKLFT